MEPFGTLLGLAPGGVAAYSSDYETASESEYPKRSSFRSYYDGAYMGYKWQCVEFARRWLYINKGYIFNDVAMAYDIFELRSVRDVKHNTTLPLHAFVNGSSRHPEPGCMLIWGEGGEFERTGHVAIVTEVSNDYVRIAEQNVDHQIWPNGRNYSRELKATVTNDGEYWVSCSFGNAKILGWMLQTEDARDAVDHPQTNPKLLEIQNRALQSSQSKPKFLNVANADEAVFVKAMEGHHLSTDEQDARRFLAISKTARDELEQASNELHGMFMHATEYVLNRPDLLKWFNLPDHLLPKIKQSWDNRLNELITSRFDFAVTANGLKAYEYNCDSASCYMEAGKVQGRWLSHFGIDRGTDASRKLFKRLTKAWKKSKAKGLVHIIRDQDIEEEYHALFMQDAIVQAGLQAKVISSFSDLNHASNGTIVDKDGDPIHWVWKTWAWETALDQVRASLDNEGSKHASGTQPITLADVLLHPAIMVYEPLWTLIPSNKAILPVLWEMFPNHPNLLNSSFTLTPELEATGYVVKPIVGRCGANISVVSNSAEVITETDGKFDSQTNIYQQFFALPRIQDRYTQLSTFMVAGSYAGSGARVDASPIINKNSDCLPLIVEPDSLFLLS